MIKAGTFDFHENNFSFNTVVIDTDRDICDLKYYIWNHEKKIYIPKIEQNNVEIKEIEVDEFLKPNINFTREFFNINNYKLDDVFVFPDIDKFSNQNKGDRTIKNLEELFDFINDNNIIYIEGDGMSGKSSLAKAIYLNSIKRKKVPLFVDFNEINKKKYESIIKDAFCYQYSYDKTDYEKFKQTLKEDKIIIVDNLDKIPEKLVDDFVNTLKQDFKKIVLLFKPNDKCDIVELTKQRLNDSDLCERLRILPFYLRKRKELIKNILSNSVNKVENIDGKVIEINNFISNQLQIFSINPNFITMYVSYYVDNIHNIDVQTNLFSKVFETNLVKSLTRYIGNESIEEYFTILENLAYKMHYSKIYPISIQDIQEVIADYNSEYMMEIDSAEFRRNAVKANILDEMENDTFKFSDNSYLAYFVACSLNKMANNGEIKNELDWICKNLCFNINGEILLFLSYITKNVSILNYIFQSAKEIMKDWAEFDIDNNNISFLTMQAEEKFEMPTVEQQQEHEQNLEKQEKVLKRNLEIKTKSIYDDYDETRINSKTYKVNQAMRHLELVSKILPNFNHLIKKDEKINLAEGIYEFPNKICNEVLHQVDSNFNYVMNDLLQYCEDNNIDWGKDKIINQLQLEAELFILNLFDMTARLSTNAKTIKVLDSITFKNINYSILNVMMYENLGDFGEFTKRADLIYDNNRNPLIRTMIKRIVRKHFLCNKGLKQIKNVQRVADKYFGQSRKYLI
ncbi:MAG: ATP-binding protein [Clostridiales bacterium]|nr:ATP-binding protein [Clostridiales bacterium]